jgi:hypothetical protein
MPIVSIPAISVVDIISPDRIAVKGYKKALKAVSELNPGQGLDKLILLEYNLVSIGKQPGNRRP